MLNVQLIHPFPIQTRGANCPQCQCFFTHSTMQLETHQLCTLQMGRDETFHTKLVYPSFFKPKEKWKARWNQLLKSKPKQHGTFIQQIIWIGIETNHKKIGYITQNPIQGLQEISFQHIPCNFMYFKFT
jgi:hypothetical protein